MTCKVGEACSKKDREVATFDFVSARGAEEGCILFGRRSQMKGM